MEAGRRAHRNEGRLEVLCQSVQSIFAGSHEMHHVLALPCLSAKPLPKQVGDIGLIIDNQDACATRRLPEGQAHVVTVAR
jgi:hypothetical protein